METFKKQIIITLITIIVIPITIGSLSLVSPWYGDLNIIDEGQLGAWANHMLHGKLMFKDIYITYGPLYLYPLYIAFKLFGPSAFVIRFLYLVLFPVLSLISIYLFITKLKLNFSIQYLLILFLCIFPGAGIRQGAIFFVFYSLLNISLKNLKWAFLAGISTIITLLITSEAGVFAIFFAIGIFSFRLIKAKKIKDELKVILNFSCGMLAIIVPFVFWASAEGWLAAYLTTTFDTLISFSGLYLPNGMGLPNPIVHLTNHPLSLKWIKYIFSKDMLLYFNFFLFPISLHYILVKFIKEKWSSINSALLLTAIVGITYYYSIIGRSGNFFLSLTPSIIIIFYFLNELVNKKTTNKFLKLSAITFIFLIILRLIYIYSPSLQNLSASSSINKSYINRLGPITISTMQAEYISKIQNYVKKNSNDTDYIFFLSNEPMLYMMVDRVNPSRFDLPYIAHTIDKRYEMLNDFNINPPKLIFYDTVSWPVDGVSNIKRLPEIVKFINKNYYAKELLDGRVRVYIKKDNAKN